ncbi:MAG: hypothetical protein KJO91_11345 [Gammaproteobacteria bacterium]|nr:hypothetical protein [Gammaproteobacteria bacterium]
MLSPSPRLILCDSHVHFYDCFELDNFLDSAWNNFYQQAKLQQKQHEFIAVLLLTEAKEDRWFLNLKENKYQSDRWSFLHTDEAESLYAVDKDDCRILIINGRQIVTSENMEVLALITDGKLEDGKPMTRVIDWVKDNNAIPVIPWGFGKWWGNRGRVLSKVLESYGSDEVLLGDNSGRPWFLGRPNHFKKAGSVQRRILPGSDPLPFASESWRPGSVGFYFTASLDDSFPAKSMRESLKDAKTNITNYMRCERLLPFIRNQVAMQLRNRI